MESKDVKATSVSRLKKDKPRASKPKFGFDIFLQHFHFDSDDAGEKENDTADESDNGNEEGKAISKSVLKSRKPWEHYDDDSHSAGEREEVDGTDSADETETDTADDSDTGKKEGKAISKSVLKRRKPWEHCDDDSHYAGDSADETETDTADDSDNGKKDEKSQIFFCHGKYHNSVLAVLHKRFKKMAKELEKENPSLKKLAGDLLTLIKEHPDSDTNNKNLEETASNLLRNEKVLNALVKHAKDDSHFQGAVGCCLCHVQSRKFREQKPENIDRLRADCMYGLIVEDQDTDVLCSALSIVFGYWLGEDFFDDKRSLRDVFNFTDVERIEEKERLFKKICDEEDKEMKNIPLSRRKKKALENPKRNTTPHTQTRGCYGLLEENHNKTNGEAREVALRIVSFFLEATEGSFDPEGHHGGPQPSWSSMSPELLERLTQKITQEIEVDRVKQSGTAQTPEKEHTPQVAPVTTEDLEPPKKRVRLDGSLGST